MQQNMSKVKEIRKALKSTDKHDHRLNKQISNLQQITNNVLQQNQNLKDMDESMEKCDISQQLQDLEDIQYNIHQWNEYAEMSEDQTDLLQLLLQQLQSENNNLSQDPQQQFEDLMRKSQFKQMEATMNAEVDALNEQLTNKESELSRLKKVISNRNRKLQSLSRKRRKSFLENVRISELKDGLNDKTKELEEKENEIAELKQIIVTRATELRRLSQESNLAMHEIAQDTTAKVPIIDINNLFQSTLDGINELDLDHGIEDVDFDIIMSEQEKIAKITRRVTRKINIENDAIKQIQDEQSDSDESGDRDEFIDKLQNDIQDLRSVIKKAKSQQYHQNEQILAANEHNLETEDKIDDLKAELREKGDQLNHLANLIEKLRDAHKILVDEQQQEIQRLKDIPIMDLEKLAKLPIHIDSDDEIEHLVKIKLQDLMELRNKMDRLLTKSSVLQRVSVAHDVSGNLFDQVERLKKVITNRNHKLAAMWKALKDAQNENELNAMKEEIQEMEDAMEHGFNDGHLQSLQHRLSGRNRQIKELQQLVEQYKENKQLKEIEAEEKGEEFEILRATLRSTMDKLANAQNELDQFKTRDSRMRMSGNVSSHDIELHDDPNERQSRQRSFRTISFRKSVMGPLQTIDEKTPSNTGTGLGVGTMCFMVLFVVGIIQGILYSDALINIELDAIPGMMYNGISGIKEFGADFDFNLKDLSQSVGQSVFDFVVKFNAMTGVDFSIGNEEEQETFKYDPNAFDEESKDSLIITLQSTIQNKDAKMRLYQQEMEMKLDNQRFEIRKLKKQFGDERIKELKATQFMIDNKHRKIRVARDQMVYQLNQQQNKMDGLEQRIEELKIYIQQLIWHFTGPHLLPMNVTEQVYIQASTNIIGKQGSKMNKAIPAIPNKESKNAESIPQASESENGEPFMTEEIASILMGLLFTLTTGVVVYQVLMRLHLPTLPWYKVTLDEAKRWQRRDSTGRLTSRFSGTGLRFERVN